MKRLNKILSIAFSTVLLCILSFFLSFTVINNRPDAEKAAIDTKLSYPAFDLVIYNYHVYNTILNGEKTGFEYVAPFSGMVDTTEIGFKVITEDSITFFVKNDTLHLYGISDEYIGNKLMQIIPKKKSDRFIASYWVEESITEQLDYRKFNRADYKSTEEYMKSIDTWDKNKVSWKNITKYMQLNDSLQYFYRMPIIGDNVCDNIKKKMNLRDTLVDLSGESINIAKVVYKNKPCYHGVGSEFLQIERFNGSKRIETKYIFLNEHDTD